MLGESLLDVELHAVVLLIVLLLNGIECAAWAVLLIVCVFEADESEWSFLVLAWDLGLHKSERLDVTIFAKDASKLGLIPVSREVLDVDVVESLSKVSSILGLVWVYLEAELAGFSECLGGLLRG